MHSSTARYSDTDKPEDSLVDVFVSLPTVGAKLL